MIRFAIGIDQATVGWASLTVETTERTLTVQCADDIDTLGGLVRGFADLSIDGGRFEVVCYEEPAETVFAFSKSDDQIKVVATRYSWQGDRASKGSVQKAMRRGKRKDWAKMSKSRNKKAALRYSGPLRPALMGFADAFKAAVSEVGLENYEKFWGHPCPVEAIEKLKRAVG